MRFSVVVRKTILCFLFWIVSLLILPIVVSSLLSLALLKWIVNSIVKKIHPDWLPLTALDLGCSMFIQPIESTKTTNNIGFAIIINQNLELEEIKSSLSEYLINIKNEESDFIFDRLRKRPIKFCFNYYWKIIDESYINLNKLFVQINGKSDDNLENILNKWMEIGWGKEGPLWEFLVYKDNKKYIDQTIIAFKMSHVLGDGIAIAKMLQALSIPKTTQLLSSTTTKGQQGVNTWHSTWKFYLKKLYVSPGLLLSQVYGTLYHSDLLSNIKKSDEKLLKFATINLQPIRKLSQENNCKFSDILLCLWGNVLRRILLDLNISESDLPEEIPVISPREIQGRIKPMQNLLNIANMPVRVREIDRLRKLTKLANTSRHIHEFNAHGMFGSLISLAYILPSIFIVPAEHTRNKGACCQVSSFPLKDFLVNGSKLFGKYSVSNVYFLQQLFAKDYGITTTFLSRDEEKIDVTFVINEAIIKDKSHLNKFQDYLTEEFDEMIVSCSKRNYNNNLNVC